MAKATINAMMLVSAAFGAVMGVKANPLCPSIPKHKGKDKGIWLKLELDGGIVDKEYWMKWQNHGEDTEALVINSQVLDIHYTDHLRDGHGGAHLQTFKGNDKDENLAIAGWWDDSSYCAPDSKEDNKEYVGKGDRKKNAISLLRRCLLHLRR